MSLIRQILKYILRNWRWFLLSIFAMLVSTYINVYIPLLSGMIIRDIFEMGDFSLLTSLVIQILALTVVLAVFSMIHRYANGYFSQRVVFNIRNDVFRSIQRQSFGFFDKMKTGQLMSRATTDVNRIGSFVRWQLRMLIDSIFLLGAVVSSMVLINWNLTLISSSIISILFFTYTLYGKKIRPVVHTAREHFGDLTSVLWENITGIRVVRSFSREDHEKKKFDSPNTNYYDRMMQAVRIRSVFRPLHPLLVGFAISGIYWYGGLQVIGNQFTIDQLFVISSYLHLLVRPVAILGYIWAGYQRMAAAAERVFQIIDAVPEVKDRPDAVELLSIKGEVVLENVSFSYADGRPILKKVNLEAKPGEIIALLGPTGSGKSTIIKLLPRFYDVSSGRILIDGYDIRDLKAKNLRRRIGLVSQETFLFNITVKENIAYGRPDATMDEIVKAAKTAKAHDFITRLPEGYNTLVGERGVTLSGGQQQRIAIARALLTDPRILILDDSTSSVDVDTEYEIQQALAALFKNRTTFVVTQRVSTIRDADKIVVLEDGRIVEEGDHPSLLAKKGAYYRIYQTLYKAQKEGEESGLRNHTEKNRNLEGEEK